MGRRMRIGGVAAIVLGAVCIASALTLFLYNMWDDARAGVQVARETELLIEAVLPAASESPSASAGETAPTPAADWALLKPRADRRKPVSKLNEDTGAAGTPLPTPSEEPIATPRDMPIKVVNGVEYVAILSIPELNLELPIRSKYVFEDMRFSPCRYFGSVYTDDLVICAHNYNQHFGRLRDLKAGSEILLVDMEGVLYRYRVESIVVLVPTAIDDMVDSGYDLSLFTCTSMDPRTRTTVRCRRISD